MTAGVDTLVASASLAPLDGRAGRGGNPFDALNIGQNLKLRVVRQLDQQRYEVAFGAGRHVVESRVALQTGTQIEARVEAKGAQLELRYLSTDARFTDEELTEGEPALGTPDVEPAPRWLQELAEQYRVPLDAQAQATIARAATQVAHPELLSRGGLFLQKLTRTVNTRDLEALYRALNVAQPAGAATAAASIELDALDPTDVGGAVADAMESAARDALDTLPGRLSEDAGQENGEDRDSRRALRLLNLQDEGSLVWRYGTLPLLVGGQLIELELAMFRERDPKAARGGLKRLVMNLDTTHFGQVRIEARALDDRLMVRVQAPTADAVEYMSAYGGDVRAAIEQLGWQVDEVSYDLDPHAGRAARAVVDHVLSTGSVDREL